MISAVPAELVRRGEPGAGGRHPDQYQPLACECDQAPQGEPNRFWM